MSESSAPIVRVATYNVHGCVGLDRRRSEARIAEVIASLSADVVGLQELNLRRARSGAVDQAATIAEQLGWNVLFQPALQYPDEDFGDAIISRYPLRLIRVARLPGNGTWYCREARIALWAEVKTDCGPLQVMNTHLGLGRRERLVQAQWLAGSEWLGSVARNAPLVLLGDLNSLPGSLPHRSLTDRVRDVRESTEKQLSTFPTYLPALALDHILVSQTLRSIKAEVHRTALARIASDHFPLVAELMEAERLVG
jgi:endonuclease/exonuclease/phosphatase family metal-dependent hydrolase